MSPERWQQVERIYQEAVARSSGDRAAFLDRECAGDATLRADVERMLAADAEAGSFLEASGMEVVARAMASQPLAAGNRVGPYEIVSLLGTGGMGQVYQARDTRLNRTVALKVLPPYAGDDAEQRKRLLKEARAASALNHPHIVTLHDIVSEGGRDALVMEYVAGQTLEEEIGRKGLALKIALDYAIQIADALAAAHVAGIVHRDVKPGNIMVASAGTVKVLDFGLAKLTTGLGPPDETATMTAEGTIAGTIAYMSPEQVEGRALDARSDIFSFGAVLYEMLTGRRAFGGTSKLSTMAAILNQEPKPASELVDNFPAELDRVLARCLRKDPARRFQTMADLRVALEELKADTDSGRLTPAPARRKFNPVLLAASLIVLGAAGLSWRAFRLGDTPAPPWKLIPLTTYIGNERSPTFSPDGSQVAFVWNGEKQDNYDVYVKMVDGGVPLRLTTSPEPELGAAWSHNGRYVAFLRADGLYLVSPLGGPERRVCELISPTRDLSWSPDSKALVVADRIAVGEPYRIFRVGLDTGEKRPLTEPPPQTLGDINAAFSPDGGTLAFVRYRNANAEIFLMPSTGGSPRRLISDTGGIAGLSWMPDGGDLIFVSDRSGTPALWRLRANAPPGTEPKLVAGVTGQPDELTISHAGTNGLFRLVYSSYTADSDVWRCELPRCDHPTRLIASTRTETSAQYSPDGRRIVFSSDRSGYYEIWVSDADGSNAMQVTSFGSHAGSPRWSPDGLRIVFDGVTAGNRDIYVIQAQGGSPRRMTVEPSEESRPSFSKDGRWIYFMSDRTKTRQIWKIPSEGGPAVQVTRHGGMEPRESPDGKLLYYIKDRYAPGLRSVPVDGGEEVEVLESASLGYWGISSTGIYFLDFPRSTTASLKFYSFRAHRVSDVTRLESLRTTTPSVSVSPDDRWALFTKYNQGDSDLFLLESFR